MKKIKIDKIPSIFRRVNLPNEVYLDRKIPAEEGVFIIVKAMENIDKNNVLEFIGGRLGKLIEGDIIPAVLGYRKAPVEFAGIVPKKVKAGDELFLLCESGLVGELMGVYEDWGKPMKVKVLGALVDEKGKHLNLKNYKLANIKPIKKTIPLICMLSTRMDSGKTMMGCRIAHHLKIAGKKVAAVKVSGVAFTQDPYKFRDHGADPVFDFVDMGLPSTCNGNAQSVVESAENLINHAKQTDPDLIILEFGEAILGEYHNMDILSSEIKKDIGFVIMAANDLTGIYGARELLNEVNIEIDLVTGSVANSHLGVELIKKYFNLPAEGNLHEVSKAVALINKKIFQEVK